MNSALRKLVSGQIPAMSGSLYCSVRFEKCFQQIEIEDRLCDDVLGSRQRTFLEALELFVHVQASSDLRRRRSAAGLRSMGLPPGEAVVQIVRDVGEGRSHRHRTPRSRRDTCLMRADSPVMQIRFFSPRVGAQEFTLNAEDVAIATAEMQHGFDFGWR